jgi:hypothetical protein
VVGREESSLNSWRSIDPYFHRIVSVSRADAQGSERPDRDRALLTEGSGPVSGHRDKQLRVSNLEGEVRDGERV